MGISHALLIKKLAFPDFCKSKCSFSLWRYQNIFQIKSLDVFVLQMLTLQSSVNKTLEIMFADIKLIFSSLIKRKKIKLFFAFLL